MVRTLFSTYVRPHLEYAVSVWSPYSQSHIDRIERVQFRATRLIHSLKSLTYEDRLVALNLPKLEDRRIRGDAIQLYKCLTGVNIVDWMRAWQTKSDTVRTIGPASNTRHNHWLLKQKLNLKQRDKFFTNRAVDSWNSLPRAVHAAKSVNSFKNRYDGYQKAKQNRLLASTARLASNHLAPATAQVNTVNPSCLIRFWPMPTTQQDNAGEGHSGMPRTLSGLISEHQHNTTLLLFFYVIFLFISTLFYSINAYCYVPIKNVFPRTNLCKCH